MPRAWEAFDEPEVQAIKGSEDSDAAPMPAAAASGEEGDSKLKPIPAAVLNDAGQPSVGRAASAAQQRAKETAAPSIGGSDSEPTGGPAFSATALPSTALSTPPQPEEEVAPTAAASVAALSSSSEGPGTSHSAATAGAATPPAGPRAEGFPGILDSPSLSTEAATGVRRPSAYSKQWLQQRRRGLQQLQEVRRRRSTTAWYMDAAKPLSPTGTVPSTRSPSSSSRPSHNDAGTLVTSPATGSVEAQPTARKEEGKGLGREKEQEREREREREREGNEETPRPQQSIPMPAPPPRGHREPSKPYSGTQTAAATTPRRTQSFTANSPVLQATLDSDSDGDGDGDSTQETGSDGGGGEIEGEDAMVEWEGKEGPPMLGPSSVASAASPSRSLSQRPGRQLPQIYFAFAANNSAAAVPLSENRSFYVQRGRGS